MKLFNKRRNTRRSETKGAVPFSKDAKRGQTPRFEPLESRLLLTTLVVNSSLDVTTAGDGLVTLREAIYAANEDTSTDLGQRGNGADTITFDESLRGQTLQLEQGALGVYRDLVIQGPGADALTIDANQQSGIFSIYEKFSNSRPNVEIRGLTLTGGTGLDLYYGGPNVGPVHGDVVRYGGAIFSGYNTALKIIDSTISGNTANYGGGVYGSENLTITNCTISDNAAQKYIAGTVNDGWPTLWSIRVAGGTGGGIYSYAGTLEVINSTISNNTAESYASLNTRNSGLTPGSGGGVYSRYSSMFIYNSTIAFNQAEQGAGIHTGGNYYGDTLTLGSTIVGSNRSLTGVNSEDIGGDKIVNADHSLIQNVASGTVNGTDEANIYGVDPMLAPLADNGGPTMTHALYSDSPAINTGSNPLALAYDQRGAGFPRTLAGATDIGAFEGTVDAPPTMPVIVPPTLEPGVISVSPTSGLTTSESGGTASFSVSLSKQPLAPVTITVDTSDASEGLVSSGGSVPASSAIVTFTPLDWSAKVVTVTGVDDALLDGDIAYTVRTQPASSADPSYNGLNAADVSVVNRDNDLPSVTIGDVTAMEGNKGNKNFTFTVALSQPAGQAVTVNYATANGTATTADADYTAKSGSLTFSPGETSKTISVSVKGDTKIEVDETFYVNLISALNASIADGQGLGTILNDDAGGGGGGSSHGNSGKSAQASSVSIQPRKKHKKQPRGPASSAPAPVVAGPESVDLLSMAKPMAG